MMYSEKDKLDHLIELAPLAGEDDIELLDSIDDSNIVLSKRFYRKRNRIIRRYKYGPIFKSSIKTLSKVAVIVLIIMSLSFVTVLATPHLRKALFDAIIEWYEEYIAVRYIDPRDIEKEIDAPLVIEEYRKPRYIPDGVVEVIMSQKSTILLINYYVDDEWEYTFSQKLLGEDNIHYYNKDIAMFEELTFNDIEFTAINYSDEKATYIIWHDEEYSYELYSETYNVDLLIEIAKSVK